MLVKCLTAFPCQLGRFGNWNNRHDTSIQKLFHLCMILQEWVNIGKLSIKPFRRIEVKLQKQALEKQKEAEVKQQRKPSRGIGMGL